MDQSGSRVPPLHDEQYYTQENVQQYQQPRLPHRHVRYRPHAMWGPYSAYEGASSKPQGARSKKINIKTMIAKETDERLLQKDNGETVLHKTIALRDQASIMALLESIQSRPGLFPLLNIANDKEQTPLFLAVTMGLTWLTETLAPIVNCDTLCRFEVCEGQVEYLSALHYACKYGDRCLKEVHAMLLSPSTHVDSYSRSGMTALHLALWNHGQVDSRTRKHIDSRNVINALVNAGAQCESKDNKTGKTALHFAVETCSLDVTKLILESQYQVETLIDKQNYDRRTALHFAVSLRSISEENKIDLVRYLISKGANRNTKDKNNQIPKELVSPTDFKMLEVFDESPSPAGRYDEDSYPAILNGHM